MKKIIRRIFNSKAIVLGLALSILTPLRSGESQTVSEFFVGAVGSSPSSVLMWDEAGTSGKKLFETANITAITTSPSNTFAQFVAGGNIYTTASDGQPHLLLEGAFASTGLALDSVTLDMFFLGGSETGLYKMKPYAQGTEKNQYQLLTSLSPFVMGGYVTVDSTSGSVFWTENGFVDGTSTIKKLNGRTLGGAPTTVYSQLNADEGGRSVGAIAPYGASGVYFCLPGTADSHVRLLMGVHSGTPTLTPGITVEGRCTGLAYQQTQDRLLIALELQDGTGRISIVNSRSGALIKTLLMATPVTAISTGGAINFNPTLQAPTPIVSLKNKNAVVSLPRYPSRVSNNSVGAFATKVNYSYELALKGPGTKKNKTVTTTKSSYTYSRLKAGSYTLKYRVIQIKGKKVTKNKYSADVKFTMK